MTPSPITYHFFFSCSTLSVQPVANEQKPHQLALACKNLNLKNGLPIGTLINSGVFQQAGVFMVCFSI
jgi:hypothetical protein